MPHTGLQSESVAPGQPMGQQRSLEAQAVTSRSGVELASQRALMAGADLILMTGDGSFRPVSLSFLARARRDRAFRARVR